MGIWVYNLMGIWVYNLMVNLGV